MTTDIRDDIARAELIPGGRISIDPADSEEGSACPECGEPMDIVQSDRSEHHERCRNSWRCDECDGTSMVIEACPHGAERRLPSGQCRLCLCWGDGPAVYDEYCQSCDEGRVACDGELYASRYDG